MRQLWRDLSSWFFSPADCRTAAVLRIGFCFTSLLIWWDFYPVMSLLFGHAGLFGTLEPFPFAFHVPQHLLFKYDAPWQLQTWFWVSVGCGILGTIGCWSRTMVGACFCSMVLFNERGPFITFGADLVLHCIGFWLLFLRSGQCWSIDSYLRKRSEKAPRRELEGWPIKAIQLQMGLIYLTTGMLKIGKIPWEDGSAVYYSIMVGNVIKSAPPSWLIYDRPLLGTLNYLTIATEITAPLLLFYRPTRVWGVTGLVLFHTGIDLLMSIRFFSLVMYVGLLSFADRQDWGNWSRAFQEILNRCRRRIRRRVT